MSLKYILFPPNSRFFPGQRWANICLRTLHLIGVAGLGGGFLYPAAGEDWRIYLDLVVWAGVGRRIRSERPTPAALRRAILDVLKRPRYRDASTRIAADMAAAPGFSKLAAVVDELVGAEVGES